MNWLRKTLSIFALALPLPALAGGIPATMFANPNCGCCGDYARYLKAYGFDVKIVPTYDLAKMQKENGVSPYLAGCHTMKVGAYLVDGLIPVEIVNRLLRENPPIKGITVPGMPVGAPGMPGAKKGPIDVYYISSDAPYKVYATF